MSSPGQVTTGGSYLVRADVWACGMIMLPVGLKFCNIYTNAGLRATNGIVSVWMNEAYEKNMNLVKMPLQY
jgi:hypothetical protein